MVAAAGILNKIIEVILRSGSAVSFFLMAVGLGLFLLKGPEVSVPFMSVGIVVLVLTPFLRVTGALLAFVFVERDIRYAFVSLGVLLLVTAGLFLSGAVG